MHQSQAVPIALPQNICIFDRSTGTGISPRIARFEQWITKKVNL